MNRYDYKVKWCDVCNQGWVEIVEGKESEMLLLQCSECESQWDGLKELLEGKFKLDEELVKKPELKKIIQNGWVEYIKPNL